MPSRVSGDLGLGGQNVLLPRGSLAVAEARELLVDRSLPGAYEADGAVADDTLRKLGSGGLSLDRLPEPPAGGEVVETCEEEVVWGGHIAAPRRFVMAPYGHFMIDSVARLWPLLPGAELEGLPVVFTTPRELPYVHEWLAAFGARLVELPAEGAVRFERMHVPEAAWQVDAWVAPEMRDVHLHARRGMDVPAPARREGVLWLSRSGLGDGRVPEDEDLLESLLDEHVTVVDPAKLTLAEQVAALESSRAVAGVVGSAFHTLLLTAETPECLYLCPPWDRELFPAQHRLLDSTATFAQALEVAALGREQRREGIDFPSGYRLVVPQAVRALAATVLPDLRRDEGAGASARVDGTPADVSMEPGPGSNGKRQLGGQNVLLSRGSLSLAPARELLVFRSAAGAFESDGSLARDTLRAIAERGLRLDRLPAKRSDVEVVRVDGEETVWAGNIAPAYGHFLVESVAWLWPLLPGAELEGLPAVFATPREPPYVREWLAAFGARLVELPAGGAVRFEKMFVPEPAWRMGAWLAPEMRDIHLHARRGMAVPSVPEREVSWLSRAGLTSDRVPYDEALLEWLLGDRVAPIKLETMTLAEQVAALESSRAVAGVVGSAFHTLLLAEKTPECLYLCPPWDKAEYPAQHRLMEADATFAQVLEVASWTPRMRRQGTYFPGGYRLSIPAALRALSATVLPDLLEDERLAGFADPERRWGRRRAAHAERDLDAAVARVLLDPLSVQARQRLGDLFEAEGNEGCAQEQFACAAGLQG